MRSRRITGNPEIGPRIAKRARSPLVVREAAFGASVRIADHTQNRTGPTKDIVSATWMRIAESDRSLLPADPPLRNARRHG